MDEGLDSKTLSGLLGLLAHDLRNPLSALHSNVGFLAAARNADEEDLRDAVNDALVSCDGLVAIIDNIEILSQSMSGLKTGGRTPLAVASVVEQMVKTHRAAAESHDVELAVDPSAVSPSLRVSVHQDMYRRALGNALRNAIQHGAGRSVRLTADAEGGEVRVIVLDQGARLDTGLGDVPFSAAGQLTAKGQLGGRYGRGLGLFCARFAAESAGGRLVPVDPPAGYSNALALIAPAAPT